MRIIYYSQAFFTDCDFPLIRELQRKGIDVFYFINLWEGNKCQALLDIKKLKKRFGIYKASNYPEMSCFKEYLDLDKIYFINIPEYRGGLFGIYYRLAYQYIYKWVIFKMRMLHADIFHFTWQFRGWEHMLASLPYKKVMTVHDPISHSSVHNKQEEIDRIFAFNHSNRFILLSNVLKDIFSMKYNIAKDKISLSRMGEFSFMPFLKTKTLNYKRPYILFFGQISSYKGVEYLCEAMVKVHNKFPDINLLIAGSGKIYFDYTPYKNLDYILLKNEFLSISDLSSIIQNSLFTVCPYKDATQSGVVQTSFSCNTPTIVTNVGALPDAVKDGITGFVVPPCDSNALAEAIEKLLSNPQLLAEFKKNIDTHWRPSMDWDPIADLYIKAWNEAM